MSLLRSIHTTGYLRSGNSYATQSTPPLEFGYTGRQLGEQAKAVDAASLENLPAGVDGSSYRWTDLDGEGISGILAQSQSCWYYKRNLGGGRFGPLEIVKDRPSQAGARNSDQRLVDLDGNGCLDLVSLSSPMSGYSSRVPRGGWSPFTPFPSRPNLDWTLADVQICDTTGDGLGDILLTGQGSVSVLPSLGLAGYGEPQRHSYNTVNGPGPTFSNPAKTTLLADMSGDGLQDIVHIENSSVTYLPSLGHGRFGPDVVVFLPSLFDDRGSFDPSRILLGDVDGSGTTDIVYVRSDGSLRVFFNECGNTLSKPVELPALPNLSKASKIDLVDLFGDGTLCLVWSSSLPGDAGRQMRYVDLMQGTKPHLLYRYENNMGLETRVSYSSSTKFYLADRAEGALWPARLHFPVHVVERVEEYDRISGRYSSTRYAFHDGFFDGVEREFGGFGRVEKWDTEEAGVTEATIDRIHLNYNESSYVPPVKTVTWYHTGCLLEGRSPLSHYSTQFYREPGGLSEDELKSRRLLESSYPSLRGSKGYALAAQEKIESLRALKGSVIRQEVYGLDGSTLEDHPYLVTEIRLALDMLQPRGPNKHATFFAYDRESIKLNYERALYEVGGVERADPCVTHVLTLEADDYGNPTRSLSINYGRHHRPVGDTVTDADWSIQQSSIVTLTVRRLTETIASETAYRLPIPCESQEFELTDFPVPRTPSHAPLIRLPEARTAAQSALDNPDPIPFETFERPRGMSEGVNRRLTSQTRALYRPDNLDGQLPLGETGALAIPFESYTKLYTAGLLASTYVADGKVSSAAELDAILAGECGLVRVPGDQDWWLPSGRTFFSPNTSDSAAEELQFAKEHFFLPHRHSDAYYSSDFDTESFVSHDKYKLFVTEHRDALGNRRTVGRRPDQQAAPVSGYDYRVLAAREVMDPNMNLSSSAYDILGQLVAVSITGKPGDRRSESVDSFDATTFAALASAHIADPLGKAAEVLGPATGMFVCDLFAYQRTKGQPTPSPIVAFTLSREQHMSDLPEGELSPIQQDAVYLDGKGREIQRRAYSGRDAEGNPVWTVSGWAEFNNKGDVARQYEPFFDSDHRYDANTRASECMIYLYDPLSRQIGLLRPDHAWEKVVLSPWVKEIWDANDTLMLDPVTEPQVGGCFRRLQPKEYLPGWHDTQIALGGNEATAAKKAIVHAGTPAISHCDSLGRCFLSVTLNKYQRDSDPEPTSQTLASRAIFDSSGNVRRKLDNRGRTAEIFDYDLTGGVIRKLHMDAGPVWTLNAAGRGPVRSWAGSEVQTRYTYDVLRRPQQSFVKEGTEPEIAVSKIVYGEELLPDPEQHNWRTRAVRSFDQVGLTTTADYDFKGNPTAETRQFAATHKTSIDWSRDQPAALLPEIFRSEKRFDALNRETHASHPGIGRRTRAYTPDGRLATLDLHPGDAEAPTPILRRARYDARGRLVRAELGNGATTTYDFDPLSSRLVRARTARDAAAFPNGGALVQDLAYAYDAVGNAVAVRDGAQQDMFFRNERVEPRGAYTYDALYRLVAAEGREHLGAAGVPGVFGPWDEGRTGVAHPGDGSQMGRYVEGYEYDDVGNLKAVTHQGGRPDQSTWTREYFYEERSAIEGAPGVSNRLSSTRVRGRVEEYGYEGAEGERGNVTKMPHLTLMKWDYRDQLRATATQRVSNGEPETTWYVYNAAGARVRKVTEGRAAPNQEARVREERFYLNGCEVYRRYAGDGSTVVREMQTLDVGRLGMGHGRIALVETLTKDEGGNGRRPRQLHRFQFSDLVDSAALELDETGKILSYEEYAPFGSTTYQAVAGGQVEAPKRYRFNGKERDSENGFYYYGARYMAPWLGRWISCDPGSLEEGGVGGGEAGPDKAAIRSPYNFCDHNPIVRIDKDGRDWLDKLGDWIGKVADARKQEIEHTQKAEAQTGLPVVENAVAQVKSLYWLATNPTRATVVDNPIYHSPIKRDQDRLSERTLTLGTLAINFSSNVSAGPDASKTDSGSNANALRHTMLMALVASRFGGEFAEQTGQAHEASVGDHPEIPLSYVFDSADAADTAIDVRNNHAGVQIGLANPGASPTQLALRVLEWAAAKGLYGAVEVEGGGGKVVQALWRLDDKVKGADGTTALDRAKAQLGKLDQNLLTTEPNGGQAKDHTDLVEQRNENERAVDNAELTRGTQWGL